MVDEQFWDRLAADDGNQILTHRSAREIIRTQKTHCIKLQGHPDRICTGGTREYPQSLHDLALRVFFGLEPALPESITPSKRPRTRRSKA